MLEDERLKLVIIDTTFLNEIEKKNYQPVIGCLLFVPHRTWPDIMYVIIRLLQFASKPEQHPCEALKRVQRYLKSTKYAYSTVGN